jgi:phage terminase large subunit-like protein
MVQGGLGRAVIVCLCALSLLLASASAASGSMYFGATISGETYGQTGNAPWNTQAWNLFERHAGKKVAILNQSQSFASFNEYDANATYNRGAIPLVTMGLQGTSLESIAKGGQDAAIKRWAQEAKAWGHPFLFAPWWEMNGGWYAWGRSSYFVAAWKRFHDLVVGQGASNVTWTWLVNGIWSDPASDPSRYYPGASYVDWMALDSYNWGRNPAQPDRWITPEQTITPTLKVLKGLAPGKPIAIVEDASTEYGGNKTDWIREMLTTYLPHHPEIKAYMWFNWNFKKGEKREDWPIESSAPAQQQFRKAIQSGLFVSAPVSLPWLTKVPAPPARSGEPAQAADLTPALEMASGPDVAVARDGSSTVVWSSVNYGFHVVFMRRIAVNGTLGPIRQLSAAGQDAFAPRVAVTPAGLATVVWARSNGTNFLVQARRISAAGIPEESTKTLSASGQDAAAPQVATAADGTATVVWKRFDGAHYLVQERRISAAGVLESVSHTLSATGQDAVEPQVAVAGTGTATVVWTRFDGYDGIVQARQIEPSGTPKTATLSLSVSGESAVQPQLAVAPSGVSTVVWNRFNGTNWIIQERRLSAAGALLGGVYDLSAGGRSAAEPQVAVAPDGATTIVWDRFDGTSFVVQARRLDPAGVIGATTFNLSALGRDAADPQVAISPSGVATVLWSRFDGTNFVVQRRDLFAIGSLGGVQDLSTAGRTAGDPSVAWGAGGTLAMTWRRFNGAGDVVQRKTVPQPTT